MGSLKVRLDDTTEQTDDANYRGGNAALRGGTLSAGRGSNDEAGVIEVSTDRLAASMRELKAQLAEVFTDIREVGQFELSSIELGLEINSEGGFNLIGSLKAGAKGAIKLKFEPPKS